MNLSDSTAADHPDTLLLDALGSWLSLTLQSAADAADRATAAESRSLHTLIDHLVVESDAQTWQSVTAAVYFGLSEASGNQLFGTLVYDLWQLLTQPGGRYDVAAAMWPQRRWAEESLRAVINAVRDAQPGMARAAMNRHLRTAFALIQSHNGHSVL